eukprot:331979-Rhodomonas_salina.1
MSELSRKLTVLLTPGSSRTYVSPVHRLASTRDPTCVLWRFLPVRDGLRERRDFAIQMIHAHCRAGMQARQVEAREKDLLLVRVRTLVRDRHVLATLHLEEVGFADVIARVHSARP